MHKFNLREVGFSQDNPLEHQHLHLKEALNSRIRVYFLPLWSHCTIFFSVTILPEFRESREAKRILGRYRLEVAVHSLIGLTVFVAGLKLDFLSALFAGLVWQVVGCSLALHRARRKVAAHAVAPSTLREASLEPQANRLLGGWPLQVGPFAIIFSAVLTLHAHWNQIPERFAVHWDLEGHANGWASRSFTGVYGALITAAGIATLLLVLNYLVIHRAKHIHAAGVAADHERRFQRTTVGAMTACSYFLVLLLSWLSFSAWRERAPNPAVIMVVVVSFALAVVIVMAWSKMNVTRAERGVAIDPTGAPIGDRTDDRYWKWGFYVNPSDPALMVQKRYGLGYTFNMGHPAAWLILAIILGVALAAPLIISISSHA